MHLHLVPHRNGGPDATYSRMQVRLGWHRSKTLARPATAGENAVAHQLIALNDSRPNMCTLIRQPGHIQLRNELWQGPIAVQESRPWETLAAQRINTHLRISFDTRIE